MKSILPLSILTILFTLVAGRCLAMMPIEEVSKARAKELGMEVRTHPAGPDAVRVELEFKREGEFKSYSRVDLEMSDGGKLMLSSTLQEEKAEPGHVLVSFAADRAHLDKLTLRVVSGVPRDMVGHDLRVKDFVVAGKAAAPAAPAATPAPANAAPATPAPATPTPAAPSGAMGEEEARFLTAVRKAFDTHDAAVLTALTCWVGVPEKRKENTQGAYKDLVEQKGVTWDFKLVDVDQKSVDRDHVEDGVTYRPNLPIAKQLDMKFSDANDKRILGIIGWAVGEKDGKLLLLGSAPVK